jgi:hypothetical protein
MTTEASSLGHFGQAWAMVGRPGWTGGLVFLAQGHRENREIILISKILL